MTRSRHSRYETIRHCAIESRLFLEQVWPIWNEKRAQMPNVLSKGTCGRSSLFLRRVFAEEYNIESVWTTGGDLCGPTSSGFYCSDKWNNHSWLEVDGKYIVDITTDQFDDAPILVVPITDRRYRRGIHDCADAQSIAKRRETVNEIWPEWVAFKKQQKIPTMSALN